MVFEGGSATVLTDGAVSATFGHEVNRNEPTDFSSVIFARSEKGKVEACGVNRGTAVKPQVVSAPDLRMYQDDLGFPMNLKACVEQGQRKAEPLLSGELATEGYVTEYSGFVQCALERSVSSIQHVWYGGAAHTFIAINAPGAAMALGSADTPQRFDSETRANQSRKLGDQIGGGGI
jgi:hypothetical protein